MNLKIRNVFNESITLKKEIINDESILNKINEAVNTILAAFKKEKKLFIAGNGGSASDAQHMAAELVGRFVRERKALPAIALTTDSSILTSLANDYGFEHVFSRQLEANATAGDIFLAISTSGNSKNIIKAVEFANQNNIYTISLTGSDGGVLKNISKLCICVPSNVTARIQEAHITIIHAMCELIEKDF